MNAMNMFDRIDLRLSTLNIDMSTVKDHKKIKRKIIKIDKEKCTGCGNCVIGCDEGALEIINGKAEVVNESFCDGLGACIGECPEGALTIEIREAHPFDEEAVKEAQETEKKEEIKIKPLSCSCPSSQAIQYDNEWSETVITEEIPSALRQWPIKIELVNPEAPYFNTEELVVVSDCSPLAYGDFHRRILKGRPIVSLCPMLGLDDDVLNKLKMIIQQNPIKHIELVLMEVPCCKKISFLLEPILSEIERDISVKTTHISRQGKIKNP
ncbi:MAG: 4Fe-4S dicluster domain-containing protein [Candidatus Lokiarchaeota archaeon]|nr:4Fe-4S dicluster domain-containing protein [Candidatus Lokiarchaeota archaeon]